jgi:signal peptidase I
MNDSHDPYNTPPDPERFQPRRDDEPEPEYRRSTEPSASPEPFQAWPDPAIPAGGAPAIPDDRGRPLGDPLLGEPLPALEPLPAAAGNFGASAASIEGGSLSSRLVDEFVAWLKTLASAAVYATLIVTFGFQVARVEGQSMAPTLQNQDRLIVNKFAYLSAVGEPKAGDIVMLYYPINPVKSFVKRVIAKENQRVRIVDGKVFVDDQPIDDSFVPEQYKSHDDWGPEVVPEGYYFVMGDHRNNSSDSRHWGFVPKKYIIGRVQLRWWPVPEARTF